MTRCEFLLTAIHTHFQYDPFLTSRLWSQSYAVTSVMNGV